MKFASIIFLFLVYTICCGQSVNPFDIPKGSSEAFEEHAPTNQEIVDSSGNFDSNTEIQNQTITPSTDVQPINNNPFDLPNPLNQSSVQKPMPNSMPQKTSGSLAAPVSNREPGNMKLIVLIYSLVMMVILTLSISIDRNRFSSVLKSGVNSNYLKTLFRDTKAWTNPQFIILYIFFVLNLAFVVWLILLKSSYTANLFIIIGAVFLCYVLRHLVMWSITAIYPVGKEVSTHNYSIALHNSILGIILLPMILIVEFVPGVDISTLGYLAIFVVVLIYILRQSKGLLSCLGMRSFNPFYFFIYLCAVEIAPILVGFKMMIGAL